VEVTINSDISSSSNSNVSGSRSISSSGGVSGGGNSSSGSCIPLTADVCTYIYKNEILGKKTLFLGILYTCQPLQANALRST
jgi:hypothetical protein